MELLVHGLNHTTAPIAVRERIAFPGDALRRALADLRALCTLLPESAILSTCNRTELYCLVNDPAAAERALTAWLAKQGGIPPARLRHYLYTRPGEEAVRHLFRVASGLDSIILGEPHILGQVKDAERRASDAGTLGAHLHQLFQRATSAAKDVRSRIDLASSSVSIAAATIDLARREFPELSETRILLIGAGKMIELAAGHFAARQPRALAVANRTHERAELLARRHGGIALPMEELRTQLPLFDVIVACTASPLPILSLEEVQRASRARRRKPLVIVDLAVPRGVAPAAARLPRVFLHSVDDLGKVAQPALASRQAAIAQAHALVDGHVAAFKQWMAGRGAVPLLRELESRVARLCSAELQGARRRLAGGHGAEDVLAQLAARLGSKFLHAPRSLLARGALAPEVAQKLVEQWDRMRTT